MTELIWPQWRITPWRMRGFVVEDRGSSFCGWGLRSPCGFNNGKPFTLAEHLARLKNPRPAFTFRSDEQRRACWGNPEINLAQRNQGGDDFSATDTLGIAAQSYFFFFPATGHTLFSMPAHFRPLPTWLRRGREADLCFPMSDGSDADQVDALLPNILAEKRPGRGCGFGLCGFLSITGRSRNVSSSNIFCVNCA